MSNLSKYFEKSSAHIASTDSVTFFNDLSTSTKEISKEEPKVCRIFSETSTNQTDPNSSFFDLIAGANNEILDDGFSTRIAMGNEEDRRRDAWIPSESTKNALITCATSSFGTYFPERELLTMPGVILEEDLIDDINEMVTRHLGETEASQCKVLTADDVTQDERGLRELIQFGFYRSAINLTGRLLTIYGQGSGRMGHPTKHSPHSLQLWFTRIALLLKIKSFALVQAEAEPFNDLDKPDLFYQFYPEMYGKRPGSMASFAFRLLLAEMPLHFGKPAEATTRLFRLLAVVNRIITNLSTTDLREDGQPMVLTKEDRKASLNLWTARETRIRHSIINCALAQQNYQLVLDLLEQLLNEPNCNKKALTSAIGRVYLQMGDIQRAENYFKSTIMKEKEARLLVDKALLATSCNAFHEAHMLFEEVIKSENGSSVTSIASSNNAAVCLLYNGGKIADAITLLETAIETAPSRALCESLVINLCNLYEIQSANCRPSKLALLKKIAKYKPDTPSSLLDKLCN